MSSKVSKLHLVAVEDCPKGGAAQKEVSQLLQEHLGGVQKMTDIECYKILMRIYEVLGKEMPRALPTKRGLVVCTSNDLELDDFKTVRDTLAEILSGTLGKL